MKGKIQELLIQNQRKKKEIQRLLQAMDITVTMDMGMDMETIIITIITMIMDMVMDIIIMATEVMVIMDTMDMVIAMDMVINANRSHSFKGDS